MQLKRNPDSERRAPPRQELQLWVGRSGFFAAYRCLVSASALITLLAIIGVLVHDSRMNRPLGQYEPSVAVATLTVGVFVGCWGMLTRVT